MQMTKKIARKQNQSYGSVIKTLKDKDTKCCCGKNTNCCCFKHQLFTKLFS